MAYFEPWQTERLLEIRYCITMASFIFNRPDLSTRVATVEEVHTVSVSFSLKEQMPEG